MTMTAGEMLLLLYDEIGKRLMRAQIALEKENYKVFDESVQRCIEIVQYLRDTLDFKYEISQQLDRMYDFFLYELRRLSAGRNPQIIEDLHPLVKELREAFAEASKSAKSR
jgi:flagellar protein FliS